MKPASYVYAQGEWGTLARDWKRSLEADNKSPNTIRIYLHAVRMLGEWASEQPEQHQPTTIPTAAVRDYVTQLIARTSAGNADNNFRCLRTFFRWLVHEEELDRSPMDRMRRPQGEEKLIQLVTDDMMVKLLASCNGRDFVDRRDTAILRVLFDMGPRRNEIAYLELNAVDMDIDVIYLHGKGRRDRSGPMSPKTSQAMSRYLRVRARHPQAALPALWLGATGQGGLTHAGIKAILIRRAKQAGLPHIHPHMFRHTVAHAFQAEGGSESDLMLLMGWKSSAMPRRYGSVGRVERAHSAARRLRIGDRV